MKQIYLGSNMNQKVMAVVNLTEKKIESIFELGSNRLEFGFYMNDINAIRKMYNLNRVIEYPIFGYKIDNEVYDFDGYLEETGKEITVLVDFNGYVDYEKLEKIIDDIENNKKK